MPGRMLRILAGALAVGVLATVAAVATADAPRSAKGTSYPCYDHDRYPPHSYWGDGFHRYDGDGHYWRGWGDDGGYFGGQSYDPSCYASDRAGMVDRVMVAAQRLRGSQCQHLFRSGRLSAPGDCSDLHWMRAKGTRRWTHSIPSRLPAGMYRLHRRAVDLAGNRERRHTMRVEIR